MAIEMGGIPRDQCGPKQIFPRVCELPPCRSPSLRVNGKSKHSPLRAGEYVRLEVRDTGIGMDEVTRQRAFEPFFTTKSPDRGTGLGLSTVYGIAKQSGGKVFLSSRVGEGTTVTVYLPRLKRRTRKTSHRTAQKKVVSGRAIILLVDDNLMLRKLLQHTLEEGAYMVIAASDGREALKHVNTHNDHIDLLVTDVIMPGINGTELAARLNKRFPSISTLYMSGYSDERLRDRYFLTEKEWFIQKTFTIGSFLTKVEQALTTVPSHCPVQSSTG